MNVLVPVANGSESLETVTLINVLRRAEIPVVIASVESDLLIMATKDVQLKADKLLGEVATQKFDAIVLPGGEAGSRRLGADATLIAMLTEQRIAHRWYGGICAAPALCLSPNGLLDGKQATCHPLFKEHLLHFVDQAVVTDGHCMTSQGPGTTLSFALQWIENLVGRAKRDEVASAMLVH